MKKMEPGSFVLAKTSQWSKKYKVVSHGFVETLLLIDPETQEEATVLYFDNKPYPVYYAENMEDLTIGPEEPSFFTKNLVVDTQVFEIMVRSKSNEEIIELVSVCRFDDYAKTVCDSVFEKLSKEKYANKISKKGKLPWIFFYYLAPMIDEIDQTKTPKDLASIAFRTKNLKLLAYSCGLGYNDFNLNYFGISFYGSFDKPLDLVKFYEFLKGKITTEELQMFIDNLLRLGDYNVYKDRTGKIDEETGLLYKYSDLLLWAASQNPPVYPSSGYFGYNYFPNNEAPLNKVALKGDIGMLRILSNLNPPRLPDEYFLADIGLSLNAAEFLLRLDKSIVNRYLEESIRKLQALIANRKDKILYAEKNLEESKKITNLSRAKEVADSYEKEIQRLNGEIQRFNTTINNLQNNIANPNYNMLPTLKFLNNVSATSLSKELYQEWLLGKNVTPGHN